MSGAAPVAIPPLLQLEQKHQVAMRMLIARVVRSFYEPKHIILMELLSRHHILRDDDLAGRVGLNVKELNKIMATLIQHRLVQRHGQQELKENQGRVVGKAYFWIDLQKFCNVIKWRMNNMRNTIDSTLKTELENKGYICPRCGKSFTTLDAGDLYDPFRNVLACDLCNTEVVENENSEKVKGSKDRMQRFNAQMKWIGDGLRSMDGVVIPAFDVVKYIRDQMAALRAGGGTDDDGLKIASGSGKVQEVEIHMADDEDDEERKRLREKRAEEKRMQNLMPTWHTTSTITGEKTALGIKAAAESSNRAILDSLDAQAKAAEAKKKSFDTEDTEEYYDNLINGTSGSPQGTKRKRDDGEEIDPRYAKVPRRDGAPPMAYWPAPGYPGMPYGYPPYPMHPRGMPLPGAHPYPPATLPVKGPPAGYYMAPTPSPVLVTSQSSAGTSRNTPSQGSDSESSQEKASGVPMPVKSSLVTPGSGLKPAAPGIEKRVSFADEVVKAPPVPEVPKAPVDDGYNPTVTVSGKEKKARDVSIADWDMMTADEAEIFWPIQEKLEEMGFKIL